MTLLRELAVYLTLLLSLLFAGSFVMNISNARSYLQDQLESHAQDTATSLGVAIAVTEADNIAAIDSIIDAVFDRGYYRVIRFTNPEGEVLVNSEYELTLDDVPTWFVKLVNLKAPAVSSEVNRGWMLAGNLYVASHLGYAYRSLWSKTLEGSVLFCIGLLLAIIGLNIFLNIVMRPLGRLEEQANAICNRSFDQQKKLPKTRDLRRVVEAMNRMAGKLEKQFSEKLALTEELREQSVKDALTGVLNWGAFDDRMASVLLDEESFESGGGLLIAQVSGLDDFNKLHGRNTADLLLIDIAHLIGKIMEPWPQAFVGRRSGSEFCVFIPACDTELGERIAEECYRALASLPFFVSEEGADRLHIAMVSHVGRTNLKIMLQQADQLLLSLQQQSGNSWQVRQIDSNDSQPYYQWSEKHWQESLTQVLESKEIELFYQTIYTMDREPLFVEVFARLKLLGELVSAEAFLPMVERFDLHVDFDKVVIGVLMTQMLKDQSDTRYCVNLSPRSLLDGDFYGWLLETLNKNPGFSSRIILEVPERTLLLAGDKLPELVRRLLKTECRFSVDHFGITSRSMTSLHELEVDYIKIDGSFIRGISKNYGNQFYLRTLAMLANSKDITLLAQSVEQEEDWDQLRGLGVQGGQGFYLGRPKRF